jgi:hypothetical protein
MTRNWIWASLGAAIAAPIGLVACATEFVGDRSPPIDGSGVVVTQSRPVSDVHAVEFLGDGELDIRQGESDSLSVEADDNIINLVTTTMRGDCLVIATRPGVGALRAHTLRYRLVIHELTRLSVSGSGSATLATIQADVLNLTNSGSGSIVMGQAVVNSLHLGVSGSGAMGIREIKSDRLDAEISGSGELDVSGQTRSQQVTLSGSGGYLADQMKSDIATVEISGSGSARVACSARLVANISGSGGISYNGSPDVESNIWGSGGLSRIEE